MTQSAVQRREILQTAPSPDPRHDYLAVLAGSVGDAMVEIRYVPDRLLATPASLAAYFAALDGQATAEALALDILDDLNNELVPRWVQVMVSREQPLRHRVVIDDRQPGWSRPADFPV